MPSLTSTGTGVRFTYGPAGSKAGQIFQDPYQYQPRFPWGQGSIKVVSCIASEDIPAGVAVQIVPGAETVRVARDAYSIVGVTTYDPTRHTSNVVYNRYDVVPVVRIGSIFVRFTTVLPPFREPFPMEDAFFYASSGVFTTDLAVGLRLAGACFSVATREYYQNSDGSPQQDIPYPVPAPATMLTTFGEGVALVDLNLG
jgi:hypothetical protein